MQDVPFMLYLYYLKHGPPPSPVPTPFVLRTKCETYKFPSQFRRIVNLKGSFNPKLTLRTRLIVTSFQKVSCGFRFLRNPPKQERILVTFLFPSSLERGRGSKANLSKFAVICLAVHQTASFIESIFFILFPSISLTQITVYIFNVSYSYCIKHSLNSD